MLHRSVGVTRGALKTTASHALCGTSGNIRHEYRQISPPLLREIVQHLAPLDAACRIELAREQVAEQDEK
jgi:hypothetical protein